MFVSSKGPGKNMLGRLVEIFFFIILLFKNVFYARFMLIESSEGGKNFRVGIFLSKNLIG